MQARSPRETLSRDCDSPESQVECNVKKEKVHAQYTPSNLSPSYSLRPLLPHSLPCANTLLYGRPLLEMRKSQISILGARTVAHYQRYTLCLRLNTPSRFGSRRGLIEMGQLSTLEISESRYQRSREIMRPARFIKSRKEWITVWIFKTVMHKYNGIKIQFYKICNQKFMVDR